MHTILRDGRRLLIRPIRADDGERLRAAFARLSPESVRNRFLAPKHHLTDNEVAYLVHADGHDHYALVAVLPGPEQHIVAVGRWVRLQPGGDTAEFAIVVGDPFQGQGLGKTLALALADGARAEGVRRLSASILADNVPAHRLVHAISARLAESRHVGSVDEIVLDLAA